MSNPITVLRQGESLPFQFDRSGEDLTGWVCTIEVKQYPGETSLITPRVVQESANLWTGFLTSTETSSFPVGIVYRLIGVLTNAGEDEEEQVVEATRFSVTTSWAT